MTLISPNCLRVRNALSSLVRGLLSSQHDGMWTLNGKELDRFAKRTHMAIMSLIIISQDLNDILLSR